MRSREKRYREEAVQHFRCGFYHRCRIVRVDLGSGSSGWGKMGHWPPRPVPLKTCHGTPRGSCYRAGGSRGDMDEGGPSNRKHLACRLGSRAALLPRRRTAVAVWSVASPPAPAAASSRLLQGRGHGSSPADLGTEVRARKRGQNQPRRRLAATAPTLCCTGGEAP
jgi:hypothetical protein